MAYKIFSLYQALLQTRSIPRTAVCSCPDHASNHPSRAWSFLSCLSLPIRVQCACLGTPRGKLGGGIPLGKAAQSLPWLPATLSRNERQGAPGREAAPARISLPGGAA